MLETCLADFLRCSEIIRNLGLVIGGTIALYLAVKRVNAVKLQAETQQKVLLKDRYQRAIEMLEDEKLLVQLAGIIGLEDLGLQRRDYRELVIRVLNAYIATRQVKGKPPFTIDAASYALEKINKRWEKP